MSIMYMYSADDKLAGRCVTNSHILDIDRFSNTNIGCKP